VNLKIPIKIKEKLNKFKKKDIKQEVGEVPKPIQPTIPIKIEKDNDEPIVVENKEPMGLTSQLKDVSQKLDILTKRDKKQEQKEFKLPSNIKRQLKKIAIKNKVMVLYLRRNRCMNPMICDIRDGFITIDGKPYDCSMDYTFLWKGKYPSIVIKEWDICPVGTEDYYEAVKEKRTPEPISIAIRMMESAENVAKKTMSPKAWIFIGLAVIAGIYIMVG